MTKNTKVKREREKSQESIQENQSKVGTVQRVYGRSNGGVCGSTVYGAYGESINTTTHGTSVFARKYQKWKNVIIADHPGGGLCKKQKYPNVCHYMKSGSVWCCTVYECVTVQHSPV